MIGVLVRFILLGVRCMELGILHMSFSFSLFNESGFDYLAFFFLLPPKRIRDKIPFV